ncbi:hypothetical protein RI138_15000 [Streptomyces sp. C11-1]|uniref:Lipoprotein n=1 Tax=Streptomyces durocortorensis TaxID=2811104 RepID=A0ABY9VVS9_9ACTN|nr:hypothetical protein [Streptomyces durocortorensis]WNF28032.1 hypothetical protein RI138_15000 [Streptomyces durocortorensis]
MRPRRTAAVAVAVAVPLLLGGCGIQGTGVVEAGGPATVEAFFIRETEMLLFFRAPHGGVNPVIRTTGPARGFGGEYFEAGTDAPGSEDEPGPVPTEKVVRTLLAGPAKKDRAAGLTTSLPTLRPGAKVRVEPSSDGRITIRLPFPLKPLDATAVRQLTCTIAYSQAADGRIVVELKGQDGASSSTTCDRTPGSTGSTAGTGSAPTVSP